MNVGELFVLCIVCMLFKVILFLIMNMFKIVFINFKILNCKYLLSKGGVGEIF